MEISRVTPEQIVYQGVTVYCYPPNLSFSSKGPRPFPLFYQILNIK